MAKHLNLDTKAHTVPVFATLIFLTFWLTILTFPSFFLFNPLLEPDKLRRVEFILSTLGWIFLSTIAPIVLWLSNGRLKKVSAVLPLCSLVYPLSLAASQITIYVRTGSTYLEYLINYPIFFLTDILFPILIILIWRDLKKKPDEYFQI